MPATSASIFSRLGGKTDDIDIDDEKAMGFAGILKSAPKKVLKLQLKRSITSSIHLLPLSVIHLLPLYSFFFQIGSIKKASKPQQKTILVKRIPAKAATMVADEYEAERMETGEKTVKFSSTDEILEIESRKKIAARTNQIRLMNANNVKSRLGLNEKLSQTTLLHRTKKIIKLKQSVKRTNGQTLNVSPLRSDEIKTSVKNRLSLKNGPDVSKLVNRIGRVSLGSRLGSKLVNDNQKSIKSQSASSVFDRLGFNKK